MPTTVPITYLAVYEQRTQPSLPCQECARACPAEDDSPFVSFEAQRPTEPGEYLILQRDGSIINDEWKVENGGQFVVMSIYARGTWYMPAPKRPAGFVAGLTRFEH